MKAVITVLLVFCLSPCVQADTPRGLSRTVAFMDYLQDKRIGTIENGSARDATMFQKLSHAEVKGITSFVSRKGVIVSDVNLTHGALHRYSLQQVTEQIQNRTGEVQNMLGYANYLYSYPDPQVSRLLYHVIRSGLVLTMWGRYLRLTFKSENGKLQLRRIDCSHYDGSGS